jgi:O-antigen ligase
MPRHPLPELGLANAQHAAAAVGGFARPAANAPGTSADARRRRRYATAILTLIMLALMPVVSKADATSSALSPSRAVEVAFELLALGMSALLVLRDAGPTRLRPLSSEALISIVFGIWAMVTALFSPFLLVGMVKAVCLILLSVTACLTAFALRPRSHDDTNAFIDAAALAFLIALAILLVGNCVIWKTPIPLLATEGEDRPRLFLGNSHPLQSAEFLSIGLIVVLQSRYRRGVKAPLAAALIVLLVLAGGRGAGIGTTLGLALMVLSSIPRSPTRLLLQLLGGGVLTTSLLIAFANFDVLEVLASIIGEDLFSLNGRLDLWRFALDLSLQYPIMGVGYYNTRFYVLDLFEFAGHTHSSLLEALAGTGIIGGALLLGFVISWTRSTARYGGVLLGCYPGIFIAAVLDPVVLTPGLSQFMLIYLVAGAQLQSSPERAHNGVESRARTAWRSFPQPARALQ